VHGSGIGHASKRYSFVHMTCNLIYPRVSYFYLSRPPFVALSNTPSVLVHTVLPESGDYKYLVLNCIHDCNDCQRVFSWPD
jgi:hypothetical protein